MTDTLKSICDQCTYLKNPQLDFLPSDFARHRDILLRDLRELTSAASNENEKSVAILAGCILEGILYSFIQSQREYIAERRGSFQFNPDHSLENYVNIFNRWFGGLLPGVFLPDSVVGNRDLVHINRELNSPINICAIGARDMLRTLDALLGALSQFAAYSTEK